MINKFLEMPYYVFKNFGMFQEEFLKALIDVLVNLMIKEKLNGENFMIN